MSSIGTHSVGLWHVLSLLVCVSAAPNACAQLQLGGDISALTVLEGNGAAYSNNGVSGDAVDILESYGANSFRLRLFVDPTGTDPVAVQDLAYTINLAQRAKANGSSLLLDLHYSDTWADPGQQSKPSAWGGLSFSQLEQQVYDYTKNVVEQFSSAGVLPEIIQVGNEIGNGLLWDEGRLWRPGVSEATEFNNLASLLSAGINGARDGSPAGSAPSIMIHHSQGANWGASSYYFDRLLPRLQSNGTDIDVIGYSYYPIWHYSGPGNGDIADLQQNLNNTASTYDKPVYLVETGFAYTGAQWEPTYEFPVSESGQRDFLQAVVDTVEGVPNDMGKGVYWWYPEATPTSGVSVWQDGRYGLFDQSGDALPALQAFADANPSVGSAEFTSSFLSDANSWPGSAVDAGIFGQGFSPSVDSTPDPGHTAGELVGLDRFTFFKDGNTDSASNIKLAVFDNFYLDLSGLSTSRPEFMGLSTNTIASTAGLGVGDPYTFEFDNLQLEYGGDYGALFVNDDGLGNLTPVKVSALTADYSETSPGSGVFEPTSNYGGVFDFQYATSNFINSTLFGDFLTGFSDGGDAKFEAVFDAGSPGDFDGNGVVNGDDLTQWRGDFGTNADSDANSDGSSDIADILFWQRDYDGLPSPLPSILLVPEPGSIGLILLASTMLLTKRINRVI